MEGPGGGGSLARRKGTTRGGDTSGMNSPRREKRKSVGDVWKKGIQGGGEM